MTDVLFGTSYATNGVLYFPLTYVKITDGEFLQDGVVSFVPSLQEYVVIPLEVWPEIFPEITKQ